MARARDAAAAALALTLAPALLGLAVTLWILLARRDAR